MNSSINHTTFNHIISSPNYFSNNGLTFIYSISDCCALGFVLPKRLGAANKRNLFKRRCRALFKKVNQKNQKIGLIIKTNDLDLKYNCLSDAFSALCNEVLST